MDRLALGRQIDGDLHGKTLAERRSIVPDRIDDARSAQTRKTRAVDPVRAAVVDGPAQGRSRPAGIVQDLRSVDAVESQIGRAFEAAFVEADVGGAGCLAPQKVRPDPLEMHALVDGQIAAQGSDRQAPQDKVVDLETAGRRGGAAAQVSRERRLELATRLGPLGKEARELPDIQPDVDRSIEHRRVAAVHRDAPGETRTLAVYGQWIEAHLRPVRDEAHLATEPRPLPSRPMVGTRGELGVSGHRPSRIGAGQELQPAERQSGAADKIDRHLPVMDLERGTGGDGRQGDGGRGGRVGAEGQASPLSQAERQVRALRLDRERAPPRREQREGGGMHRHFVGRCDRL